MATPGRYLTYDKARAKAYRWGEDGIAGHVRPLPAPVLRAGVLERARSAPEGAAVRGQPVRGQSRRGREGVLLPRRQHADATRTCACSTSIRRRRFRTASSIEQNQRRAGQGPEYELLDTGVFEGDRYFDIFIEYAKADPEDSGDPDHRAQPRARRRAAAHPADLVVPQHVGLGAGAAARAEDHVRATRTACAW